MKKALNLVIMYFITLFIGVAVGTILYSFYINVLNFVAGTEIKFFSKKEIFDAFFYVSFSVLFLICLFISYYRIRHPGGFLQIIAFAVMALLTWCVLVPCVSKLSRNYSENERVEVDVPLSKKYFRQAGDKVYYFTKDFDENINGENQTTAIVIDTSDEGVVQIENVVDNSEFELNKVSEPYKEILVKNTFHENDFPLVVNFRNIISMCEKNINGGVLPFIGYLSFGLAISSVFALTCAFHWNLLNTMLITILSFLVLILNSNPGLFSFLHFDEKYGTNGFCNFIGKFGCQPVMVIVNFLLSFVFILIGVIIFVVRKHKEREF